MANDVEIRITADDLTGPAFASALARMKALKDAAAAINAGDFASAISDATTQVGLLADKMQNLGFGVDTSELDASLGALKAKIQSLGIADLADVNVSPGVLSTRLQLLKRLIGQSGVSDFLDLNLSDASLARALSKLKDVRETIPVNFDIGPMPNFLGLNAPKEIKTTLGIGLSEQDLASMNAGVSEMIRLQVETLATAQAFGDVNSALTTLEASYASLAEASKGTVADTEALAALSNEMDQLQQWHGAVSIGGNPEQIAALSAAIGDLESHMRGLAEIGNATGASIGEADAKLAELASIAAGAQKRMSDAAAAGSDLSTAMGASAKTIDMSNIGLAIAAQDAGKYAAAARFLSAAIDEDARAAGGLASAFAEEAVAAGNFGATATFMNVGLRAAAAEEKNVAAAAKDAAAAGALANVTFGRFLIPTGTIKLFGGALAGIPFVQAIGGMHLLIDSVAELIAVVIPVTVALIAFGAAAAPSISDIYKQMSNLYTVTTAFGNTQYPMTGQFEKMANAVQPQIYQMFGQALVVMNAKTGEFTALAAGASKVLDQLGARTAAGLVSGGFSAFMKNAIPDMKTIGDIFGNITGTIGNLLHTFPGYAQILLGVLDGVTKALEAVTASPITQWVLGVGLSFHGFIVWGGLAVTAAVWLGNALAGLAVKFGLASEGALAFNGAQFAAGLRAMFTGIVATGAALVTFAGEEAVAGGAALTMSGMMEAAAAINPFTWVLIVGSALAGLIYWLSKAGTATVNYGAEVKAAMANAPVTDFSNNLIAQRTALTAQLAAETKKLADTQQYMMVTHGPDIGNQTQVTTQAYRDQLQVISSVKGAIGSLGQGQANYNALLKAAGGNQSILNMAGITSTQILNDQGSALAQDVIQVEAAAASFRALSLGVGQNYAAMNAMNNSFLNETLPALQKVTTAEDTLINAVLAGEQATISANQSIMTAATDFQTYGKKLDGTTFSAQNFKNMTNGLNAAQLTAANDFYSTILPAYQKQTDALQQQGITTSQLTGIIADNAKNMLQMAGGNVTARIALEAYINNALGPGTVSLQNLDSWVKKNSVSLNTYNGYVSAATTNASNLASVMTTLLTPAMANDLVQSSHLNTAMSQYAADLLQSGANAASTQKDRARLIQDLFNLGLNFTQINSQLKAWNITPMTNKSAQVTVNGKDTGLLTASGTVTTPNGPIKSNGYLQFHERGGLIDGPYGTDVIHAMLTKDETVFPAWAKNIVAPLARKLKLPGFASGGLVGGGVMSLNAANNASTWMQGQEAHWASGNANGIGQQVMKTALSGTITSILAGLAAAAAAAALAAFSGPGGGAPAANAALARKLYPAWGSGAEWTAWNNLEMAEAGWNQYARNPSSGAYGIPQALPPTKMPFAAQAAGGSNPTAQISWMHGYIAGRYGDPINAWGHEMAYHWYGAGGAANGVVGVGDMGAELIRLPNGSTVIPAGQSAALMNRNSSNSGCSHQLEWAGGTADSEFMTWLKKNVRIRGGDPDVLGR